MNNIWKTIQQEVTNTTDQILNQYIHNYFDDNSSLSEILLKILVKKYSDEDLTSETLSNIMVDELEDRIIEQDISAFFERDFACKTYLEVLLLNRGFHALAAFRVAHKLWCKQDYFSAKWINKRSSEIYGIDIHPAAKIGRGLVIDHCIGIVIGETCEIGNDVFLFHNVTLGGTGHTSGDRHPKIKSNVVIGTGTVALGNITLGENAVVAAGSVVLDNVPANAMVAGVPASIKGKAKKVQQRN